MPRNPGGDELTTTGELVGGQFDGLVRMIYDDPPPAAIAIDGGYYSAKDGNHEWRKETVVYRIEYMKIDANGDDLIVYVVGKGEDV